MYRTFVADLHHAGLLRWCRRPRSRVTAFCVAKKSGAQRLIVDCRAANVLFRDCPFVPMGSGACWSEMIIDDQVGMRLTYFYACEVPQPLSEFFALPDVPGWLVRALGDLEHDLGYFEDHEIIAPVFKVLPIGFKWSFYSAQLAHAHQVKESFDWLPGPY